jgi:hypothetical protein
LQPQISGRVAGPQPLGTMFATVVVAIFVLICGACAASSKAASVASLPGGRGSTATTAGLTQSQSDQDFVDYTRCLRSHGVNEPDPAHRPGHVGLSIEIPTPAPGTNAALAACSHFIQAVTQEKAAGAQAMNAAHLSALARYARCMRGRDISMLDPTADGQLNLGNVPGLTSDFGRYSSQFRAADRSCRHLLPAGVHDDGTGP